MLRGFGNILVQGIANTLHSSAVPVALECVRYHSEDGENSTRSATVSRRLLTALLHHCSNAVQFAELADALVSLLEDLSKADDWTVQLSRSMQLASVITSVRQGSRCLRTSVLACSYSARR